MEWQVCLTLLHMTSSGRVISVEGIDPNILFHNFSSSLSSQLSNNNLIKTISTKQSLVNWNSWYACVWIGKAWTNKLMTSASVFHGVHAFIFRNSGHVVLSAWSKSITQSAMASGYNNSWDHGFQDELVPNLILGVYQIVPYGKKELSLFFLSSKWVIKSSIY